MSDQRRTAGPAPVDGELPDAALREETAHEAGVQEQMGYMMGFRERPYYDEFLRKVDPTKFWFEVYFIHPVHGPVMTQCSLCHTTRH